MLNIFCISKSLITNILDMWKNDLKGCCQIKSKDFKICFPRSYALQFKTKNVASLIYAVNLLLHSFNLKSRLQCFSMPTAMLCLLVKKRSRLYYFVIYFTNVIMFTSAFVVLCHIQDFNYCLHVPKRHLAF